MLKKNGTKETCSYSIRSSTLRAMEAFFDIMDKSNSSEFVDNAIRDKIARDLADNPLAWKQITKALEKLSS